MISEKGSSHTEANFDIDKVNLLKSIVDAVESFKHFENKADWQPVAIDTSTIARYIAYGQFESFLGASQHPSWVNLYNRINYFLKNLLRERVINGIFPEISQKKSKIILKKMKIL